MPNNLTRLTWLTLGLSSAAMPALADPLTVLFVGNSFTHGRYDPVRTYNSGFGTGTSNVHDQNCLTQATCSAAEAVVSPAPAQGVNEFGPFGGIPGIVLTMAHEAGIDMDVSINAVSAATLTGTANSASRVAAITVNPLTGKPFDTVVLQEQSFTPLPAVNDLGHATRGNYASFVSGANRLVSAIDAADAVAGRGKTNVFLYETQPLASYTYTSPLIQGSSTGGINQPYVGDPIESMARDLHDAYGSVAAQNPNITGVAYGGDAWIRAIQSGIAERNPYVSDSATQIDLWDSDVNAACCTTPIGYHPSKYGAYLNALTLFYTLTGYDPNRFGGNEQAAAALGISSDVALRLEAAAVPEPASLGLLGMGLAAMASIARTRRSRDTVQGPASHDAITGGP